MSKKNTRRLTIEFPADMCTKVAGTDLFPNGDGSLFFNNPNILKKIKQEDLIVQHNESRLVCATLGDNVVTATYEVTLAELERFVKKAKERDKYFKQQAKKKKNKNLAGPFFMHFNPELSFFIKK